MFNSGVSSGDLQTPAGTGRVPETRIGPIARDTTIGTWSLEPLLLLSLGSLRVRDSAFKYVRSHSGVEK